MKTAYVNRLTLIEKNVNPTIVCVANRRRRGWVVGKFVFLGVFEFFSLYYLFGFGWVINMFKWYLLLETALCLALALPMGLYLSDTFRFTTFAAYNVFFTLWTTFPISLWLGFWKFFVATAIGFVFHLTRFVVVAIVLVFYFLLFLLFYFFFGVVNPVCQLQSSGALRNVSLYLADEWVMRTANLYEAQKCICVCVLLARAPRSQLIAIVLVQRFLLTALSSNSSSNFGPASQLCSFSRQQLWTYL